MENKNSKMNSSEDLITAINEDKVFKYVCINVCYTSIKLANYIDNFEGIMTDYDGDTACINISLDNFTDIEPFYISCFKSDIIDYCNYHKTRYELTDIDLIDDIVILKVKV